MYNKTIKKYLHNKIGKYFLIGGFTFFLVKGFIWIIILIVTGFSLINFS